MVFGVSRNVARLRRTALVYLCILQPSLGNSFPKILFWLLGIKQSLFSFHGEGDMDASITIELNTGKTHAKPVQGRLIGGAKRCGVVGHLGLTKCRVGRLGCR
jgi:hypothetical protein